MAEGQSESRSQRKQRRRQEKKRAREIRRLVQASLFLVLQVIGFSLANFAPRDSWGELTGFLLLQPCQIVLNLIDSHFQLTRGMRDADAVLLVTLVSLPLNVLFWYAVWRGWRKLRRARRKQRLAAGAPYGAAPRPESTGAAGAKAAAAETLILAPKSEAGTSLRK